MSSAGGQCLHRSQRSRVRQTWALGRNPVGVVASGQWHRPEVNYHRRSRVGEYGNPGLWDATPLGLWPQVNIIGRRSIVIVVPRVAEYGNPGLWDATPSGLYP